MIWENTNFWKGHARRCNDINPERFDWWCDECKMAIQNKHLEDEESPSCPECGGWLQDMEGYIADCDEFSGRTSELVTDPEGNQIYPGDYPY